MPTIVFASPKGGAGKSTSAIILATELSEHAASVCVIDADPNKPLSRWAKRPGKPDRLHIIADVSEDTVIETIERAAREHVFVIVDLEGTASMMVGYALSRADFVIIPSQGSQLDAHEGVKAIKLIQRQEKAFRKTIPFAVLFTRTSAAIHPRSLQIIEQEFRENGIRVLANQIHERDAFKALFSFGGGLGSLDPKQVTNIPAARANARAFVAEVIAILKEQQTKPVGEVA